MDIEIPGQINDQFYSVFNNEKLITNRNVLETFKIKEHELEAVPLQWKIKSASADKKSIGTLSVLVYPASSEWDSSKNKFQRKLLCFNSCLD